jgi:hypothetical protein
MTSLYFYIIYLYTWKCHEETSCVPILNKQKCHFFFYKIKEQECGTGPALGFGTSGREEEVGKECGRIKKDMCVYIYIIKWDLLVRKERLQLEKYSRAQKPVAEDICIFLRHLIQESNS